LIALLVDKELPNTAIAGADLGEELLQAFDTLTVNVVMPSSLPSWEWTAILA
jgi:hypothetical protein